MKIKISDITLNPSPDSYACKKAKELKLENVGSGFFVSKTDSRLAAALSNGNRLEFLKESKASDRAKKMGLKSAGFGHWKDPKTGEVVAKSGPKGERLLKLKGDQKTTKKPTRKKATSKKAVAKKPIEKELTPKEPAKKDRPVTKNTLAADVNEIGLGYYMTGGKFSAYHDAKNVKKQMDQRKKEIGEDEFNDQMGRAQAMSDASEQWANEHGYKGKVKKVWWTARPGELSRAVGREVDSRDNPTDTLVQFEDGQFLGLSAKSTKGKGDIGFKNPGIGTLDSKLGTDITSGFKKMVNDTTKKMKLPESGKERKAFIRANPELQAKTRAAGSKIMSKLRDNLYGSLSKIDQKDLKKHILSDWMDAGKEVYPPYIKITGHGKGGEYTASITDPTKNPKAEAIKKGEVKLVKIGNESVGVMVGDKKIMKMRFKWESEPIATSMKLSGDPW